MSLAAQASPGGELAQTGHGFGTAPVFLASISTILGAFGTTIGGSIGRAMFQLVRRLQIMLQKNRTGQQEGWRPSFIALTRHGERRVARFDLLRWICHRHGFGHFIQHIEGEYTLEMELEARAQLSKLVRRSDLSRAGTFVDTLISPSFETAVTQALQFPGISGFPNNSVLFQQEHRDAAGHAAVNDMLFVHATERIEID